MFKVSKFTLEKSKLPFLSLSLLTPDRLNLPSQSATAATPYVHKVLQHLFSSKVYGGRLDDDVFKALKTFGGLLGEARVNGDFTVKE